MSMALVSHCSSPTDTSRCSFSLAWRALVFRCPGDHAHRRRAVRRVDAPPEHRGGRRGGGRGRDRRRQRRLLAWPSTAGRGWCAATGTGLAWTPDAEGRRYLFDRYGGTVVFAGRFVTVLRTSAAFLAGLNGMRPVEVHHRECRGRAAVVRGLGRRGLLPRQRRHTLRGRSSPFIGIAATVTLTGGLAIAMRRFDGPLRQRPTGVPRRP